LPFSVNSNAERKMTVYGIPEAQWKVRLKMAKLLFPRRKPFNSKFQAQYLIFEKIREEGYSNGLDVRLTVEIMVPTSQV